MTEEASRRSSPSSREPLHHVAAEYEGTLAGKVCRFAEVIGITLLAWQRAVLDDWAAVREDGRFTHSRCGLSVPRQNGKSFLVLVWVLYLVLVKNMVVVWTCHNYATTVLMLNHVRDIVGERVGDRKRGIRAINKMMSRSSSKTSQEFFAFKGGGELHFATRTKSSSLGFSFDVIVMDEAQQLTDEQAQSLLPASNAAPSGNPQKIFIGTPPRAGQLGGDGFKGCRDSAIKAHDGDICWTEFGVEEVPDPADESFWYMANPSLGEVTNDTGLRDCSRSMSALAFAQDCLGYWLPEQSAIAAIDAKGWKGCEIPGEDAPDPERCETKFAFGVKFAPDGRTCAISWAVKGDEGKSPYVELYDVFGADHGTDAFASWLVEKAGEYKACQIGIDGKSGAGALQQKLIDRGLPRKAVKVYSPRDMQDAASMMVDMARDRAFRHIESPALDESAAGSIRRKIGTDGFGFGDGTAPSAPVESAAIALHSVMTSKRNPGSKAVVW